MNLTLSLPTTPTGRVKRGQLSYRFCEALHAEFQKLRQYKTQDGGDALLIWVASDPEHVAAVDQPFGLQSDRWGPMMNNLDFVALILMMSTKELMVSAVYLYSYDFEGHATEARKKFAKVFDHLEQHAVPQIPPKWLSAALDALEGKD